MKLGSKSPSLLRSGLPATLSLRTALIVLFICLSLLGLTTCGGGGGGGGGNSGSVTPVTPIIKARTVYVNPDDSMLYSFSTDNGAKLTYFGRRDPSGSASVITKLDYVDAAGDTFEIFFDAQGLPLKVVDAQGTTVELEYTFPLISLQKNNVKAALNAGLTSIHSVGVRVSTRTDDVASEVQTDVALDNPIVVDLDQFIVDENLKEPTGNVAITVSKCGEPINPNGEVLLNFRGLSSSVRRYPAFPTSQPGRFVSRIPQRKSDPIPANLEAICTSFADALDAYCDVTNPDPRFVGPGAVVLSDPGFQIALCGQIAAAVSLAALPVSGAAAGAACIAMLAGGTLACDTLGFSVDPLPDAQNVTQRLCGKVEEALNGIDAAFGLDKVVIQAVADFSAGTSVISAPGENTGVFASEERVVSAFGPFPDLNIDSLEPTIGEFTAPGSPESGKAYSATADLSCVAGADLSIVVSRDGNPLTTSFRLGTLQNDSISVDVPADPAGKVDSLRVSAVNNVTGKSVSKIFDVIFKAPLPVVNVTATDPAAAEPNDAGVFTITRTGDTGGALTVYFTLGGSAAQGADYVAGNASSVTIPSGAESAAATITPVDDTAEESSETVIMTIQADARYTVGESNAATMNIADDDASAYVFGQASCPASLSAITKSDRTPVTLPFKRFEDNWFMNEADCYYQQEANPYNFETGMWLSYSQGACGQGSADNEVVIATSPPDSYGYVLVVVASTLRTVEVSFFATDPYYEFQNYEHALIEFVNNAVKGKMGYACP